MKTIKNNWKVALIVAVGIITIILLGVFCIQSSQNRAFTLEEQVNTADSDIKVQEKRRVDLVYNLANCVKQYDKHEAETLTAIVENRGSTGDIENVTTAITAVSEAYPELKSNENYKELMNELSITENLIAEYRSNYIFIWQKTYIMGLGYRCSGQTTADVLRNLVGERTSESIYLERPKNRREDFYQKELIEIKRKLDDKGIISRDIERKKR